MAATQQQPNSLPQNNSLLNRAAWKWLKLARADAPPHSLHLLNLAYWGLEQRVEGDWPADEEYALQEQVNGLLGWRLENVEPWLLSNPEGPDSEEEQQQDLLNDLRGAWSPEQAASLVLNAVWARQVSQNSALQPASSELD